MELDEYYTNEKLLEQFESPFDLVNYCIELAKRRLQTGQVPDLYSENQNLAYDVLNTVLEGSEEEEPEEPPAPVVVEEEEEVVVEKEEPEQPEKAKPKRELKRVQLRKARPLRTEPAQEET